ncbi:polysaccharide biosynthesis C-terminal domain-containing protein [Algoriphagus halophytocola]|uniref:oligosaccharide flippase family protein n=1 Tax=Algoriphagus halophytocola TaxID=2991499 RepID=UPI0022DE7441|nr:polysaccharide biosynthesis C-terminal domain-containing protein [Algoriphagus sp. TR-M9]WBL41240.1 polysaccharide biosynthesis C-terminal domain-containing protein [Algoriphagus sp. TR-M9]
MSKFLRDLSSVGLSKGGVIAFGLMKSIIIARWLGPDLNGTLAALTVYPTLFMTIGSLGVSQATTYHVGRGNFSIDGIKRALIHLCVFSSILSVLSCYFLIRYLGNTNASDLVVFLAILPIPFSLFITYNSGIFLGKNEISIYNRINWLPPFVVLFTTVLFIILFEMKIEGALIATLTGPFLMAMFLLFKNDFIEFFSLQFDWGIIKSLLSLGSVYAIALLIINLNYKIDIILLDRMSSPYELGIYSKGSQLMEYLWQIPMLLSTIIFARSANAKNGRDFSLKVAQLLRLSIIFIGIASIALFVLSDEIIRILFGEEFIESGLVQKILLPGVLLLTIFKVLNMDLAGKGKPWISMKAMIPALFLNIILNYILIPSRGASGASIASTISYSISALLFLYFYAKEVRLSVYSILRFSKSDFNFKKIDF